MKQKQKQKHKAIRIHKFYFIILLFCFFSFSFWRTAWSQNTATAKQKTLAFKKNALPPQFVPHKIRKLKLRRYPLTTKALFRKLRKAYKLMESKQYKKSEALLLKLFKQTNKKFDKAQIKQALAHSYIERDQFDQAIKSFKEALQLQVLPLGPTLSTKYNIIQILVSQGKNILAKKQLKQWFKYVEFPPAQAYVLYANLLFTQNKKKEALVNINYALSLSKQAKESWLHLAVVLNYEEKNYAKVEKLLRQLIEINPNKKRYWQQLARAQLLLNSQSQSLASLELAYKQKILKKEKDYLDLIYLYLNFEIPLRATKLITKYMATGKIKTNKKNYQLLAKAWVQAQEPKKAIAPLKKAASYSKDGKLYISLGQIYMGEEKWSDALFFFKKAISKKGLKEKTDLAHLMLGITYFRLSQKTKALKYFNLAVASENDTVTENAQDWLRHLTK